MEREGAKQGARKGNLEEGKVKERKIVKKQSRMSGLGRNGKLDIRVGNGKLGNK